MLGMGIERGSAVGNLGARGYWGEMIMMIIYSRAVQSRKLKMTLSPSVVL